MGFWLGGTSTVSINMTFAPNDRHTIGVSPSGSPAAVVRDLRHPIRSARLTFQYRSSRAYSYPHGDSMLWIDRADRRDFGRKRFGARPWMINRTLLED